MTSGPAVAHQFANASFEHRRDDPVGGGQCQVGPDRRTGIGAPGSARRVDRSATFNRSRIAQTAARSPNVLCWVRSGLPAGAPARRAITSAVLPRYCCSTMRGFPSTRADSTR